MVVLLLPLSLPNTRVKRSATQVAAAVAEAAAVAAVDDEDGVLWQWWGCVQWWRQRLMEAAEQLAGVQQEDERAAPREDERVAQREATHQPAGARRQEDGAVRGQQEDKTVA